MAMTARIEKAQMDAVKTKQLDEVAVSKLEDLMDKRDALKRDVVVTPIMKAKII